MQARLAELAAASRATLLSNILAAEFPSADASLIAAEVAKLASSLEASVAGITASPLPLIANHSPVASSARPSSSSSHMPSLAEKRHQPCEDDSSPRPAASSTQPAATAASPASAPAAKKFKPHRPFQWTRFHQRHIALHIAYVGADYSGFAAANLCSAEAEVDVQIRRAETGADQLTAPGGSAFAPASSQPAWSDRAVEVQLVYALKRAKLLRTLGEAQYQRCGRTDKGVSALGQVVTINLRSNLTAGVGVLPRFPASSGERQADEAKDAAAAADGGSSTHQDELPSVTDEARELDFMTLINKSLPETIQVLGWAPADPTFDARFSCTYRQYKYFFFGDGMDVARMRRAAASLVGKHDFRNFSRLDPANMTVPVRELSGFRIERVPDEHDAVMRRVQAAWDAADTATMRSTALSSRAAAAAAAAAASSNAFRTSGSACSDSASPAAVVSDNRMDAESAADLSSASASDSTLAASSRPCSSTHMAADIDTDSNTSALPTSVDTMFVMTISGTAFLWHQVRCMVAVLFMVGRGDEDEGVCARMLDVERMPRKPVYQMASELPLVLYQCGFEPEIEWRRNLNHSSGTQSDETFANVFRGFHNAHRRHAIGAAINRMFSTATARIAGAASSESLLSVPVSASSALSASSSSSVPSASKHKSSAARVSSSPPRLFLAPAPQLAGARHPRHAAHIPLARRETEMTIDERVAKLSAPKRERFEERRNKTTAVAAAAAVVCAVTATAAIASDDGDGGSAGS